MTFNVQNWGKVNTSAINTIVTLQSGVTIGANNSFNYQTNADTFATVSGANYFNTVAAELSIGDLIYCKCSDVYGELTVSAVTVGPATAVTTVTAAAVGDVTGPAVAVNGDVVTFNGTTGRLVQDSGILATALATYTGATVINNLVKAASIAGEIEDAGIVAANVLVNTAVNTMGAGSEIQLDKGVGVEAANAVTINKQSGVITSSALTTAGGATYVITLTNAVIAATSVVLVSWMGGTNTTANFTMNATAAAGSSVITIHNNTAATALNGTIIIGFTVW